MLDKIDCQQKFPSKNRFFYFAESGYQLTQEKCCFILMLNQGNKKILWNIRSISNNTRWL